MLWLNLSQSEMLWLTVHIPMFFPRVQETIHIAKNRKRFKHLNGFVWMTDSTADRDQKHLALGQVKPTRKEREKTIFL
jgi:hypothetical protein